MNSSTLFSSRRIADRCRRLLAPLIFGIAITASSALHAQVQVPGFSASLSPDRIGVGSCTELTFTIDNDLQVQVVNLAFSLTLPPGVVLATPAAPFSDCDGTVSAPDGGTTVTLSGGRVAAQSSCIVRVGITSTLDDEYVIETGDLTSSAGNSGSASVDLTVGFGVESTPYPGFTKSFSPNPVNFGGRTTLTFVIDNADDRGGDINTLRFTDTLPPGLTIADPSNLTVACPVGAIGPPEVIATPGSSSISFNWFGFGQAPALPVGETCSISVDVIGGAGGRNDNVSSNLLIQAAFAGADEVPAGRACAVLDVIPPGTLQLTKSFLDDPVAPGGTPTLQFTVTNLNRDETVSNITFTDDLEATLSGLTAVGLPLPDACGAGSLLSGTDLITLSGGSLGPGASCTFSVPLQVPGGAVIGAYPNATSLITGDAGGRSVSGTPASDTLFIAPVPIFTKEFTDDPVGPGGTVTLEYTITNTSSTSAISDLAFTDDLTALAAGTTATALPADGFCGAGSSLNVFDDGLGSSQLTLTDGNLGAGASCTFSVTLQLPSGVPSGVIPSTSSPITGTIDDTPVTGPPASDDLVIVPSVNLTKEFTDDPVLPGDTVTLEFTLSHDGEGAAAAGTATNIEFTDDLSAALAGLEAVGLPLNDICGPGSVLSGTSTLSLTGGTLEPDTSCTFSVTLQVPAAALPGNYPNTTSNVMADVAGAATIGLPAENNLTVAGLTLTKEFLDDPVLPGGTSTLEFTLTNSSTLDATGIMFTDNLDAAIDNMTAVLPPTPDPPCGPGSSLAAPGGSLLVLSGGEVPAGTSCTFQVTVEVPAATANGTYNNVTSALSATMGGQALTLDPATDTIEVSNSFLMLSKRFTDGSAPPGGTTTLEFTLTNLSDTSPITGISFTDDLDAALPGLAAVGLPLADICGAGSQISGTSVLTFTGGSLAAGASCTFDVTLQVPAGVGSGTAFTNTTSEVTGSLGAAAPIPVTGDPASANLVVQAVTLAKSFDGPASPGGTATLSFTLQNMSDTATVTDLSFSDDLDAVIPGMEAVGLPVSDVCGAGSQLAGTSFLTFTGGALLPGGSCTFDVTVQIPPGVPAGFYTNTTTELRLAGIPVAGPATADLEIVPSAAFGKSFAPDTVAVGETSTLTFTIDNSANAIPATGLDFTDNLPAGVTIANPANASTTCTGGVLTAAAGSSTISYTGGSVAAGASCTVQVDVFATTPGTFVNTSGNLTSSLGDGGTATATLTVNPAPGFAKTFAPANIDAGQVSTLTFTIDNTASTVPATSIDFTDSLPAGLVIAPAPNASTDCTGGVLTAAAGSGVISYTGGTVAAGASCSVQVDVTSAEGGSYVNTSGDLTSSLGNSGAASDTLDVLAIVTVSLAKTESIDPVVAGSGPGNLTYVITATNGGPSTATGLVVSEALTLPPGVTVDSITPSAGSFTDPAWDIGTLAAGASETLTVVLTVDSSAAPGTDVISDTADISALNEENRVDGIPGVTEATSIAAEVDIAITKTESIDPVVAGSGAGNLTYVVTVTNDGPSDATGVAVGENITGPASITIDSVTPSAGSFTDPTWTIGALASGDSVTLTIVMTVPEQVTQGTDVIANTATLNAVDQTDVNAANDSFSVATSVASEVDIALTKIESIDPVIAGSGSGNLVYTVTASNSGPSAAAGVTISEDLTLPAGVTVDSVAVSAGSFTLTTAPDGNWTLDLAPGASATLTVTLTVASDAPNDGIVSNTASLTSVTGTDTNAANDSATEETTILAGVDLVLTKTESIDPVVAGSGPSNLIYTVTVTNNGPLPATNVEVTEMLVPPGGVGLESMTPDAGTVSGNIWTIDNLAVGASATLEVALTVGPSTEAGSDTITNTAEVTAVDQPQINPGDESATESTSVVREVDLAVVVTESRDPVLAGTGLPGNLTHFLNVTNNGPSDASGVELDLSQVLPAGVARHDVILVTGSFTDPTWTIGDLDRGDTVVLAVELNVPATVPGGIDTIGSTGMVSAVNEPLLNLADDTASEATSVVSPASMEIAGGDIALDLQTALFKQTLTITNNNPLAVSAFRVLVHGLPADVVVHNAQGESGGSSYLLYNQSLDPGASIELIVEYFQEDASGGFDPSFTIELVDPEEVTPAAPGVALERIELLPNGDILIEFASTPGGIYTVQYSPDGENWFNVVPDIVAGANRRQWIDNGPPKTPSHPSTAPTRLYRVLDNSDD